MVCSADCLSMVNFSWRTLGPSVLLVTSTLVSASRTDFDTGSGTAGPIINVRLIPLSILHSWYSLRQADAKNDTDDCREVLRPHRPIRIRNAPEQFRITQILRRDHI